MDFKLIFPLFSKELLHAAMCPRAKGQGAKKEFFIAHRILNFHFFSFSFLLMVMYDVTFNVTVTI
jgi:hypothetical protein